MITISRAAALLTCLALGIAMLCSASAMRADTPTGLSQAPVLRIETGMHTAKIGRIAHSSRHQHPGLSIL